MAAINAGEKVKALCNLSSLVIDNQVGLFFISNRERGCRLLSPFTAFTAAAISCGFRAGNVSHYGCGFRFNTTVMGMDTSVGVFIRNRCPSSDTM